METQVLTIFHFLILLKLNEINEKNLDNILYYIRINISRCTNISIYLILLIQFCASY